MGLFCNKKESKLTLFMIRQDSKIEGLGGSHVKNGVGKRSVSGL